VHFFDNNVKEVGATIFFPPPVDDKEIEVNDQELDSRGRQRVRRDDLMKAIREHLGKNPSLCAQLAPPPPTSAEHRSTSAEDLPLRILDIQSSRISHVPSLTQGGEVDTFEGRGQNFLSAPFRVEPDWDRPAGEEAGSAATKASSSTSMPDSVAALTEQEIKDVEQWIGELGNIGEQILHDHLEKYSDLVEAKRELLDHISHLNPPMQHQLRMVVLEEKAKHERSHLVEVFYAPPRKTDAVAFGHPFLLWLKQGDDVAKKVQEKLPGSDFSNLLRQSVEDEGRVRREPLEPGGWTFPSYPSSGATKSICIERYQPTGRDS